MNMLRFHLAELMIPLVRRLPRGRWSAYKLLLGPALSTYGAGPFLAAHLGKRRFRIFRDTQRQAYFIVDLVDGICRAHYFTGRHRDETVPLLVDTCLKEGGTFVDVGANIGVHTVCAARRLEGRGRVYAFEPHPETFKVLAAHLAMNQIENVTAINAGLSDEAGISPMYEFSEYSVTHSLLPDAQGPFRSTRDVEIWRLEDHAEQVAFCGSTLVKIDTEGFELHVLKGMGALLDYPQLTVIAEVTDQWLREAGGSAQELFDLMHKRGFVAYLPSVKPRVLKLDLALQRIEGPLEKRQYDVVFQRT